MVADAMVDSLCCIICYNENFKGHNFFSYLSLSKHCDMKINDFGLIVTTCDLTTWQDCHKCNLIIYDSSLILTLEIKCNKYFLHDDIIMKNDAKINSLFLK